MKFLKKIVFSRFFLLTELLTYLLMPLDKHRSRTARARDLISSLFNIGTETCLFANHSSSNACIIKLTFVLCSPFLSPLPHRWWFVVALLHGFMEDLVTAVIAEVFITLFFYLRVLAALWSHARANLLNRMRIIDNNTHTGSIHFRHPYFAPKKLPVIVSKQGKKQSPGSTRTFTSVK